MVIYFGADHRGFQLKERLKKFVESLGYEIFDKGNTVHEEGDDYPDFAAAVAREVKDDPGSRKGILICGSGTGMDVTANKFARVRSVLGISPDHVYAARHDDDVNILTIAAEFVTPEDAENMVKVFLATPFGSDERYARRLEKISRFEHA